MTLVGQIKTGPTVHPMANNLGQGKYEHYQYRQGLQQAMLIFQSIEDEVHTHT